MRNAPINIAAVFAGVDRHASEMERILALPVLDAEWVAPDLTPEFRRPGGLQTLRPAQNKGLYYIQVYGGVLIQAGVGEGKTLLSMLAPVAAQAQRPLLLIPPSQVEDYRAQWQKFAPHWCLPRYLTQETYDTLSSPKSTGMLEYLRPDLIILDEAHKLADKKSARTRRFLRYLEAYPETKLVVMTASITTRSLADYAHLAKHSLHEKSPIPQKFGELEQWCKAIDVIRGTPDPRAYYALAPLRHAFGTDDTREAYKRRFNSCPGVVVTKDESVSIPIYIQSRTIEVPAIVQQWTDYLNDHWVTPNGEELEDGLAINRVARELSQGFYYRWVWPNDKPDTEWLDLRSQGHRMLRRYLPESRTGWDSPKLAAETAERAPHTLPSELVIAYTRWSKVADRPAPPTTPVWLDGFLVYDAVQWLQRQSTPSILWYEHDAVGSYLGTCPGVHNPGVGSEANYYLANLPERNKASHLALSIDAHGTGKNLQEVYSNYLVLCSPSNGRAWEQLLGRVHRPGHCDPQVTCTYYAHADVLHTAMGNARKDAAYIEESTGSKQRLVNAVKVKQ